MNNSIHIKGLEPLIPPEDVSAWPPGPGWYLVAFLLLVVLTYLLFKYIRKHRRMRYRLLALKHLVTIREEAGTAPRQEDLQEVNRLLKRTALSAFPRSSVAGIHGKGWQEFLEAHYPSGTLDSNQWNLLCHELFKHPGKVHISLPDWEALVNYTGNWIRKHKTH